MIETMPARLSSKRIIISRICFAVSRDGLLFSYPRGVVRFWI
jgi:hypothetical protein